MFGYADLGVLGQILFSITLAIDETLPFPPCACQHPPSCNQQPSTRQEALSLKGQSQQPPACNDKEPNDGNVATITRPRQGTRVEPNLAISSDRAGLQETTASVSCSRVMAETVLRAASCFHCLGTAWLYLRYPWLQMGSDTALGVLALQKSSEVSWVLRRAHYTARL